MNVCEIIIKAAIKNICKQVKAARHIKKTEERQPDVYSYSSEVITKFTGLLVQRET